MRLLFTCLHRPDRSPSQRYRFEQYLAYLNENGFECKISYLLNEGEDKIFYSTGHYAGKLKILLKSVFKRCKEIYFQKSPEMVFVQRECFMLGTSFFERKFARKSKLIFDFDDSIWLQNISEGNKRLAFLKNPAKTKQIIKAAHLVIAGNDYLAAYARQFNKNVIIIPSTIDTDKYKIKPDVQSTKITIGWSGSFSTIEHFESSIEALKIIRSQYGDKVAFMVIGVENYYNEHLGIKGQAWNASTEVEDLQLFDIGIMPLPDNEWTKGKCGMKGLQYMAAGIPTIMSAVGVNKEIIQDGENGYLAESTDEWVEKLKRMIDSDELRKKFSINGRKTIESKYSVMMNKQKYLDAFKSLN